MMIGHWQEYWDDKCDALDRNDKFAYAKAFAYGAIEAIPMSLACVGAAVFLQAGYNLITGKGWTICPKN